jgi:hypothetical protein
LKKRILLCFLFDARLEVRPEVRPTFDEETTHERTSRRVLYDMYIQ